MEVVIHGLCVIQQEDPRNNIYQRLEPNTTNSEVTDSSNAATVDFYN